MRADRLISILMLLQTRGQMTAQELADRLEVSTRTIYRDLDALSAAGVPVYAERGPQGGCRLLESYRTNLTGLKENEMRALFMVTVPGLLTHLKADKDAESALLKLTAALPLPFQREAERVRQRLHLDPVGWFQLDESVPFLPALQQAVWEETRVRVYYRRSDGSEVARVLEPYGLVAKAGVWYLVARSFHWIQTFRASRILKLEPTGNRFQRPEDFDLAHYWETWCRHFEESLQRSEVVLRVTPAGERVLIESFGEGVVELLRKAEPEPGSGCVRLTLTFSSHAEACRRLLGLGAGVQVLAPEALRQELAARAREAVALYAS